MSKLIPHLLLIHHGISAEKRLYNTQFAISITVCQEHLNIKKFKPLKIQMQKKR